MIRRSPTARHRQLIAELRRLREGAGLTREQVADAIGTASTTIFRYEKGHTRPQPADVAAMLEVYGVTGTARSELLEMAREARKRGWWHRHRQALKPGFDSYIGLEAAASVVRLYEPQTVPGLLQTAEYARAVIEATSITCVSAEVAEKVAVRSSRQELIHREADPIQVVAVLDEAVLRRKVGSPDVMRRQLEHLAKLSKLPNVVIHIIPFAAGAHCAMDGKFNLLEFAAPDSGALVYLEQATSGLVLEDAEDVQRYTIMFGALLGKAMAPEESLAFIRSIVQTGVDP